MCSMSARSPLETQALKADLRTAETVDKGHGRIDGRSIQTHSRIPSLIDFPGAKQIGRIRRERSIKGAVTVETICFITSLPRLRANAAALLKLARSHWSIENRLHRVRDVSMGEDACTVSSGPAPQALAAMRNAVLSLLRKSKVANVARATRRFAAHPFEALALLARTVADF
jgi:predicted transposase YbfD/YdcC